MEFLCHGWRRSGSTRVNPIHSSGRKTYVYQPVVSILCGPGIVGPANSRRLRLVPQGLIWLRQFSKYSGLTGSSISNRMITPVAEQFWSDAITNFVVSGNTASWIYYDGQFKTSTPMSTTLSSCTVPAVPAG